MENKEKKVLTRIYVDEEGNLIVTDLWEEMKDFFETYENG